MAYTVYKHTSPNGKIYIGITSQKLYQRFQNGNGYKGSARFEGAIKKYGWKNIKHEVLFEGLTKDEAEQKEIELISLYKSNDRRYGYNIANGGNTVGTLSQETKEKLATAQRGRSASTEARQKMSYSHKRENLSEETIQKMRSSHKGKKLSAETKAKIGSRHKGKKNSNDVLEKMINAKKGKSKPFLQFTKDGQFVREWDSLSAYERESGKNKRHVGRCLKGEVETAYGYVWKYKEA